MPLPDFLIPLPLSFWHKQQLGFDANLLLAKEVGKILSVPVRAMFKQKFDRKHFLTQGEFRSRIDLSKALEVPLSDTKLLLVAPMLDDDLFRRAGQELKAFFPVRIDALSFAATL